MFFQKKYLLIIFHFILIIALHIIPWIEVFMGISGHFRSDQLSVRLLLIIYFPDIL